MRVFAVFMRRLARTARLIAGDRRIPRPLRWLAGLALLPVPGPFDEALLVLVAVPLLLFYRRHMRDAWRRAATHQATAPVSDVGR
ncbi:MAG TPA: hypothetical protein VGN08_09015 [Solirubrobacteraceae bacterium]|jgi:hypothetical protein